MFYIRDENATNLLFVFFITVITKHQLIFVWNLRGFTNIAWHSELSLSLEHFVLGEALKYNF